MFVYVMAAEGIFAGFINGWYYNDPHNTLVSFHRTLSRFHLSSFQISYQTFRHKVHGSTLVCWLNSIHLLQIYWIQKHIFIGVWHSQRVGILLYVIFAEILFWGMVAGIFHRLEIYWKLWLLFICRIFCDSHIKLCRLSVIDQLDCDTARGTLFIPQVSAWFIEQERPKIGLL